MRNQGPRRCWKQDIQSRRAFWVLIGLVAVICAPVVATMLLIARIAEPDLSDLIPAAPPNERYAILCWAQLARGRRSLSVSAAASGATIRSLGYMMSGQRPAREGERVESFVLIPDVGNPLHQHRFGDQMITVLLETGSEVRFFERSLVWVEGTLRALPGDPAGHEPLYVLQRARAEPASKQDIARYFR